MSYTKPMHKQQRLVLIISILASFVAFLDGSVVNVALPAIVRNLGGGLVVQQWVVDAYMITLGSLMLIAGSLSDLFGRKKVLGMGLAAFGITSVLCAMAPSAGFLIGSRALQGIAGALLVPSSLALIISAFSGRAQGKAIGTWTAWTGIAFIMGPLLGGFLIDLSSWRLIFAINVLPIAVTLWLLLHLEQPEVIREHTKIDWLGTILCVVGLGGPVYALIEQAHYGWGSVVIYVPLVCGLAAFAYFIKHEGTTKHPMLPLSLFTVRNFSIGNIATMAIYAGLAISGFLITVFVQQVGHYSAIQAGLAMLPVTAIMLLLSSRFGALSGKYGPRLFMAVGPLLSSVGFLLLLRVDRSVSYWTQIFPGVLMFGLGLAATVAPLTSAVLGSIDSRQAGIASAINNAVSRVSGLIAIAALSLLTGTALDVAGFHRGVVAMAGLLIIGGVVSGFGIQNPKSSTVDKTV